MKKKSKTKGSVLKKQSVRKKKKARIPHLLQAISFAGSVGLKLVIISAVIAAISVSFLSVYRFVITSPHMRLKEVVVNGVDEQMRQQLIRSGALHSEMSLFEINLAIVKQKMEERPWVKTVKLERRFPYTLIVSVEKQSPVAIVNMENLYYINGDGEIFKEAEPSEKMDLPVITGIAQAETTRRAQLKRAVEVIAALENEEGAWSLNGLSEIHVKSYGDISLYYKHVPAEIRLKGEDFHSQIAGLKNLGKHLSRTGRLHQVKRIDLNYENGAVVSYRTG